MGQRLGLLRFAIPYPFVVLGNRLVILDPLLIASVESRATSLIKVKAVSTKAVVITIAPTCLSKRNWVPAEVSPDESAFLDYLRDHSFDAPSGSLVRAFAQAGVRRAMDLEPALSSFGYRVPLERNETFEEAETRFLTSRAEMLGEHGIEEFIRAAALLSKFGRRKSMNRRRTSYGLKHDAERMSGDYVANGMMIAAALAMGFSAERTHAGSPNAYFNISSKETSLAGA
jgi:hypothetical protein